MAGEIVATIGGPVADPVANQRKIDNAGRISSEAFKITAGILLGLSILIVIARIAVRIRYRKRLYLDDGFIVFALLCFSTTTALVYVYIHQWYINMALKFEPTVVISYQQIAGQINSLAVIDSFLALSWTIVFFVKFSFLAQFKDLIPAYRPKLTKYFWAVTGFTVVVWIFLVFEAIIHCPHFGASSKKCVPDSPLKLTLTLTIFITVLDIATDFMIISIPLIILRKSLMRLSEKANIALFLCLSIFMTCCALVRAAGYSLHGTVDVTWTIFWQYVEAGVAVILGSCTAFRTLVVARNRSNENKAVKDEENSPASSRKRRIRRPRGWGSELMDTQDDNVERTPSDATPAVQTVEQKENNVEPETAVLSQTNPA